MARLTLTPAKAAELYRDKRWSACQIAEAYGLTRAGAEARIRAGGTAGLTWCPIHHTHEELHLATAETVSHMHTRWGAVDAPEWQQPLPTPEEP